MNSKKKIVLIALPLVLLVGVALFGLVYFRIVKNPFQNLPLFQKELKVSLKPEYQNPFDKTSQYVNPFETYKNPFAVAK